MLFVSVLALAGRRCRCQALWFRDINELSNMKKLDKLEAIRGAAALYVVLHHTLPNDFVHSAGWGMLFRFGQEAVILFFVLSGFVINYSFQTSKNQTFKKYFEKRFIRLYIPLLPILLLGYLMKSYEAGEFVDLRIGELLGNVIMLQDINMSKPNVVVSPYWGNHPLWSLSYEWWFYMLFYPIQRFTTAATRSKVVLSVVTLATLSYFNYPYFPNRILMYLGIWWVGVELSNLYLQGRHKDFKAMGFVLLLIAVPTVLHLCNLIVFVNGFGLSALKLGVHPFLEFRHFAWTLFVMIVAVCWCRLGWPLFAIIFGWGVYLAPVSYGIYISHAVLMDEASYLDFVGNRFVEYILYAIIVFGVSFLLERVFYMKVRNALFKFKSVKQ